MISPQSRVIVNFLRPDLAGTAVDLDLSDDRDHRIRALGIGDAAPGQGIALRSGRGDGRGSYPARSASALTTAMLRGSFR
jgi:hypothetical protein